MPKQEREKETGLGEGLSGFVNYLFVSKARFKPFGRVNHILEQRKKAKRFGVHVRPEKNKILPTGPLIIRKVQNLHEYVESHTKHEIAKKIVSFEFTEGLNTPGLGPVNEKEHAYEWYLYFIGLTKSELENYMKQREISPNFPTIEFPEIEETLMNNRINQYLP